MYIVRYAWVLSKSNSVHFWLKCWICLLLDGTSLFGFFFICSQLANGIIKFIIKISLHFLIFQFVNTQFSRYMSFVPVCNGTYNRRRRKGGTELCNLYHFYIHILLLGNIYFYFKKINIKKIPKQNNQIIQFMFYIVVMLTYVWNVWPQWDVIFKIFC